MRAHTKRRRRNVPGIQHLWGFDNGHLASVTRGVGEILPVISFEGGEYSVPDDYAGQEVWVRQQDDEIVIVHMGRDGAHEIVRWEPTVVCSE